MMNNLRLLAWSLVAAMLGGGVCAAGDNAASISLDELFAIAEQNSAQMRPAFSAETEAQRGVDAARTGLLPDINATLSLSYIADGFTTARNFSDYQRADIPHLGNGLAINITQPVYTGGALTAGIDLSKQRLTATRYATELCRDNIRFQLTGFYLDLYKYSNLRSVVDQNIDQARRVLAQMQSRYEQGVALQNDITRYELLVSNLELQLIKIDNAIKILNDNLVTIAGLPEGTAIVPDTTLLARALPDRTESDWQADADVNAPSLKLARSAVDMSRTSERIARADRLPKIGLQAGWSFDGPILTEVPPINRNLSYWYVGIGVSYNLSSLFKTNKSIARSQAATTNAIDRLDAAKESTELTVRADYVRYLEAYDELTTQQKSLELALRNYSTVYTRYTADMALITDMLDAANAKLDAEQRLVNARINIIYHYYKLLFTSGKI